MTIKILLEKKQVMILMICFIFISNAYNQDTTFVYFDENYQKVDYSKCSTYSQLYINDSLYVIEEMV